MRTPSNISVVSDTTESPNETARKLVVGNMVKIISRCRSKGMIGEIIKFGPLRYQVLFPSGDIRYFKHESMIFIRHKKEMIDIIPQSNVNNQVERELSIIHMISDEVQIDVKTITRIVNRYMQLHESE
jgi:hypothetical protein